GAFEFQVSIMLLCMVVLGGAGSLKGVILGGMLITIFDRVALSQMTFFVRWVGRATGVHALAVADVTLWRWFFFGLGLVLVMLLKPEGLAGRRVRPVAPVDDDLDSPRIEEAPGRVHALPAWLLERARSGSAVNAIVERGIARTFQSIRLFPQMTVLENVLVGEHCRLRASVPGAVLRPASVVTEEARARERARELLAFIGLEGKEHDVARNLPYG